MSRKAFVIPLLLLLFMELSCTSNDNSEAMISAGRDAVASPSIEDSSKKEFERRFEAWKTYCSRPEIRLQSNTDYYTENEKYRAMIALGKPALPFLMEKLRAGEFFLNKAVGEIAGFDIAPRDSIDIDEWKPGVRAFSAQEISRRWVEWWKEHADDPEWRVGISE